MTFAIEIMPSGEWTHQYSHSGYEVIKTEFDKMCAEHPDKKFRLICVLAISKSHLPESPQETTEAKEEKPSKSKKSTPKKGS